MNETISDIFNNAFSNAISDFRAQGLSESEIVERLSQQTITDAMQKLIDKASADTLTYLTDRIFEIEHQRIIENNRFLAHHNAIWSECFAVSEAMYVIALEAAEDYSGYVSKNIFDDDKKQKQYTFIVLQYIHGRCCQEFLEILHLMRLGFADCAYARWRSMFELCCTASFILMQGETIAKQYFEHSQEEGKDYAWTAGAVNREGKEIIIKSFHALMDHSGVEQAWQKQYKMACLIVHGTPQGTFKRLCLKDEKQMIVVGQSDYGITTPAEHSAISLQWITSMFLSIFPNLDAIVHIKVLQNWVEEVRKRYFATEQECFTDC